MMSVGLLCRWLAASANSVAFLFAVAVCAAAAAMIEVAPGIHVTKKTYRAPFYETPFYGFVSQSEELRAADAKFVTAIVLATGGKDKAVDETLNRGWAAFKKGDYATAGKRFNQAYLIDPAHSGVYHSFAALADARFNDLEFAEELLRVAKKLPNQLKLLNADYGRLLMILKRPLEALPLLEQAVINAPEFATAWSNLGFARYHAGNLSGACAAAQEAASRPGAPLPDVTTLRTIAKCN